MKKRIKWLTVVVLIVAVTEVRSQISENSYVRIIDTAGMLNSYLRKSDTASMLSPYLRSSAAEALYARMVDLRQRVKFADTAAMLQGYARKGYHTLYTDTSAMLSGYALKGRSVQYSDTGSMLSPYLLSEIAAGTYATQANNALKVNYTDTGTMLNGYALRGHSVQYSDTGSMLSPYLLSEIAAGTYATQANNALKVNYTDTSTMLNGYALRGHSVQYSDTGSMLSPYLLSEIAAGTYATQANNALKVNYTDTSTMLNGYALRGHSVQYSDTGNMLSPYLLSSTAAAIYATQANNALKVNYTDTASMLSGYALRGQTIQQADMGAILSPYLLSTTAAGIYATQANNALKVNYTDTASMLSGYALRDQTVQQSQVAAMLSPYLLSATAAGTYATQASNALKVNYTDTSDMLSGYLRNISSVSPVMGGATLNGVLNGTQASFSSTVHLAKNNGTVVIGDVNPGTHKLAVDGSIAARKVVVNSPENWADYVFADGYSLRPLSEVEQFIKRYQHLPDVPSEKQVQQKGIDVADMQSVLLRKIEELTLYIITLEKRLKVVEKK